jgi:hypothetical protein
MTTTLNQMAARMHDGHKDLLEAVRDGRKLDRCTLGDVTALHTLARWGAVAGGKITPIGVELLARWHRVRPSRRRVRPATPEWETPADDETLEF